MMYRWVSFFVMVVMLAAPLAAQQQSERGKGRIKYAQEEILVKFKEGVTDAQIGELKQKHRLKKIKHLEKIGVHKLRLPKGMTVEEAISILQKNPLVEFCEPNYRIEPFSSPVLPVVSAAFEARYGKTSKQEKHGLKSLLVSDKTIRTGSPKEIARGVIEDAGPLLDFDSTETLFISEKESLSGHHIRYYQTYRGIPVYGTTLSVHLDKKNRVRQVQSRTRKTGVVSTTPVIPAGEAASRARQELGSPESWKQAGKTRLMVFSLPDGETRLVWRIDLKRSSPPASWEILVDALDGRILLKRNQVAQFQGSGNVFDPNPTRRYEALGFQPPATPVPTHGTDICPEQNPPDATDLTPYVTPGVTLTGLDASGFLQNAFIKVVNTKYDGVPEQSNPDYTLLNSVASSLSHQFEYAYNDSQGRFEETMAYYHLQNYRQRLKTTLGYAGISILDSQIFVDVHNVDAAGDDLSGAFANPPDEIILGDNHTLDVIRCRELAEEGDALIHEYAGHILYADINPTEFLFNPGFEEGWSDFLMVSYFDDPVVGEWIDEINGSGYRRNLANRLTLLDWQTDLGFGGPVYPAAHDNGEIWGGTLWEIRESLMGQFVGGTTNRADVAALMDTLVIESLFIFSPPAFNDYYSTGSYSPMVAWNAARDSLLTALDLLATLDPSDPRYDARYAQVDPEMLLAEFCKRELCTTVPDDPLFGTDWTLQKIQAAEAWSIQTGRPDVVVGVIDLNMAWNHADFGSDMFSFETAGDFYSRMVVQNAVGNRGTLWVNETELAGINNLIDDDLNGYEDDFIGWDMSVDHNNPWDITLALGHGTKVAGIIGAKGNDAFGTTGVNWDVSLIFLNMNDLGSAQATEAQLYATDKSARVVNASWGVTPFGVFSQALFDAVSDASDQGVLFVAAAGNTVQVGWSDLDRNPLFPQKYILPNMVLVTALNALDEQEEVYGRYTVDLGAPTGKTAPTINNDLTDTYAPLGQTSGATPHVTGAIALLLAEEKDRIDTNPGYRTMSMGEIRYLLLTSVDRLSSLIDITVSEGRLNVYKLLLNYEDSDMDGYADRIEALFDTNPFDGNEMPDLDADDDGDGLSNGNELAHGTLPRIPSGDLTQLLYPIYLEHDIAGGLTGNLLPATGPQDSDNDGLNDYEETVTGADQAVTDAANPDSDGDGFNDSLDNCPVNINPGQENNDGDAQGDVCDPDDDNDGISDIEEISAGTDPNVFADTDLDRMSDDWETIRGTDAAVDDALEDPDGDGFVNILERLRNTLPLDASSVPVISPIFVDQSNSSGIEDGTAANPFSTMMAALSAAQDGDTLQIAAGNYNLGFFVYRKPVRMVGAGINATILTATYFIIDQVPWSQVENLTVSAGFQNLLSGSRNVVYRDCRIDAVQGSDLPGNSKAVFQNCVLDGGGGIGTGINLNSDGDAAMINSTLVDYAIGISLQSTDSELSIHNSILSNNTADLSGVTDGSGINYTLISDGQFAGSDGNIGGDPLFSDPDYHLMVGSPGIDAGDPADDFSNETVPSGCLINIGAYGNTSQATVSPDPDPDGDGLTDRCETLAGTDPGNPDTDNDGLADGVEDMNGNGFVDAGETDPLNPDTDGDGSNDGYEVAAGSNPLDSASVPTIPNGDINGDGQVNAADILLAQQALQGLLILSTEQFLRGDVAPLISGVPSPDGVFDIGDVLVISRKSVGQVNF